MIQNQQIIVGFAAVISPRMYLGFSVRNTTTWFYSSIFPQKWITAKRFEAVRVLGVYLVLLAIRETLDPLQVCCPRKVTCVHYYTSTREGPAA